MKKTKIFITGMGGMTGRILAKKAADENYIVGGTVHRNLPEELDALINQGLIKSYSIDLKNSNQIKKAFEDFQPDVIIHLAGKVLGGADKQVSNPIIFDENMLIFQNTLSALKTMKKTPKLILSSGCLIYDRLTSPDLISEIPIQNIPKINSEKQPYRASKFNQELILSKEKNIDYVIGRPTQFTGPGKITGVIEWYIAEEISKIIKGKENCIKVRNKLGEVDLLDVRDVAKAFLNLAKKGVSGETYHISSGFPTTVENLAKTFLEVTNLNPNKYPIKSTDIEQLIYFRFSPDKLNKLGWKIELNVKDALTSYWKYYKNQNRK